MSEPSTRESVAGFGPEPGVMLLRERPFQDVDLVESGDECGVRLRAAGSDGAI